LTILHRRGLGPDHRASLPWTLVFLAAARFHRRLLSIGVSWIAASLQVYLRDTAQFVQVLLQCLVLVHADSSG